MPESLPEILEVDESPLTLEERYRRVVIALARGEEVDAVQAQLLTLLTERRSSDRERHVALIRKRHELLAMPKAIEAEREKYNGHDARVNELFTTLAANEKRIREQAEQQVREVNAEPSEELASLKSRPLGNLSDAQRAEHFTKRLADVQRELLATSEVGSADGGNPAARELALMAPEYINWR